MIFCPIKYGLFDEKYKIRLRLDSFYDKKIEWVGSLDLSWLGGLQDLKNIYGIWANFREFNSQFFYQEVLTIIVGVEFTSL